MLEIFSSKKRVWRAVRKGTVMAFANASIIMVASLLAYFAAYQEARFDDEQDAWEAQQKARAEAADTSSTELEKGR